MTEISINFVNMFSYFSLHISMVIDWQTIQFNIFRSSILVQMVIYFSNNLSSSLSPSLRLNVLTYLLIFDDIKTNGFITLSKYLMKYLQLSFVSTNFQMTILLTSTSQTFVVFFLHHKFFFWYFCLSKSQYYYTIKNNFLINFYLIDAKNS